MQIEKTLRAFDSQLPSSLAACGGGGGSSTPDPEPTGGDDGSSGGGDSSSEWSRFSTDSGPDFSEVDASFQAFIDDRTDFDGISYVLVDAEGIIASSDLW